ncbi:MAG: PKD domain-containing protein [Bacteroidota bacterium]|nr:PKD domain-containing protein [Bacteroidota bacterium]
MKQVFNKSILGVLMVGALGFSSCQKDKEFSSVVVDGAQPTASFTTANTSGTLEVVFSNSSASGDTYYWQFGDGTSSTEKSPAHTYKTAGFYNVTLKTNSAAGFSSSTVKTITAAGGVAVADFTATVYSYPSSLYYQLDGNASNNVRKFYWDFGDGSNLDSVNIRPLHQFPNAGAYPVKLKIYGFFNDVITKTVNVTAAGNYNLIKGGDMEAGFNSYWSTWQTDNPATFGYTSASPSGGTGGCALFPSFAISTNSINQSYYQAVKVEAGKKYKLSAFVKAPAAGSQEYIQLYISDDTNFVEASDDLWMSLNTWHGWGSTTNSVAVNGDFYTACLANGSYGGAFAKNGIYTASATKTVYICVQVGTWQGKSNGNVLVDDISFVPVP